MVLTALIATYLLLLLGVVFLKIRSRDFFETVPSLLWAVMMVIPFWLDRNAFAANFPESTQAYGVLGVAFALLIADGWAVRRVQKSVQAFEALFREVDQEVKALEAATSQVQSSLSWADAQLKEANSLAQSDVKALLDRLNIPSLDSDSLTQALFAGLVLSKIRPLFSYLEQAERYIPTKKKQDLPITP